MAIASSGSLNKLSTKDTKNTKVVVAERLVFFVHLVSQFFRMRVLGVRLGIASTFRRKGVGGVLCAAAFLIDFDWDGCDGK